MSHLHLRRAWNQHTCRRCGIVFDGEFPLCSSCAATIARINQAKALLAEAAADRERRFPPPRPRPLP